MPFEIAVVARDDLAVLEGRLAACEAEDHVVLRVLDLEVVIVELVVARHSSVVPVKGLVPFTNMRGGLQLTCSLRC